MKGQPELYIRSECINAEGPVWDDTTGTLYFIDVEAGRIFSWKDGKLTSWEAGERVGCAVLREQGGILAALESGFYEVDFPDGGKTFVADPEADLPGNRFNDGKVDPSGRLLAGTMALASKEGDGPTAALYSLDPDKTVTKRIPDVYLSNGLAWTGDGRKMYFIDTTPHTVTAYRYDPESGNLSDPEVIIRVPEEMGSPDGMTIDEEGKLWIALWGGSAISRWDPETGELLEKIPLPAKNVSSCCFGGENRDELFITTASQDTDKTEYPLAGNVFRLFPGVKGARSFKYKG